MASFEIQDDELDRVPATQSGNTPPPPPVDDRDARAAASYNPDSIDFDSAKTIGQGDGLERLKAEAGKTVRFSLLAGVPGKSDWVHYVAVGGGKARMYLCGGARCAACAAGNPKKRSVVVLCVHYTNAGPDGRMAADVVPNYKICYLSLSPTNHDDILTAPVEGSKPTEVDYRMTYDGKRYGFHVISQKSRHSQRGDTDAVKAMALTYLSRLPNKLGIPIPPNSAITAGPPAQAGPPPPVVDSF